MNPGGGDFSITADGEIWVPVDKKPPVDPSIMDSVPAFPVGVPAPEERLARHPMPREAPLFAIVALDVPDGASMLSAHGTPQAAA